MKEKHAAKHFIPIYIIFIIFILSSQLDVAYSKDALNQSQDIMTLYVIPAITNEKILPYSVISSDYISDNISIIASPGEFEPASFVIHALGNIKSLSMETTNLTAENNTISSDSIDIRVVKCWYQSGINVKDTTHKILTPELLLKNDNLIKVTGAENYIEVNTGQSSKYIKISDPSGIPGVPNIPTNAQFPIKDADSLQPIDVPNGVNKQFWITLKAPNGTQPGIYTGRIILKISDVPVKEIRLDVRILPINLLKPYLNYSLYYFGILQNNGTISKLYKTEKQFRAEMKDLIDHGVTNPTVNRQNYLDKVLQIRKESGMNERALYYLGMQIDSYGNNFDELNKSIINLRNTAGNYGISALYIYAPDEKSLDNYYYRTQMMEVHKAGGRVFDAQDTESNATSVADVLDLAIFKDSEYSNEQLSNKYHNAGHEIFSYSNPQVGVEEPETYRRNYGLLLWQRNYNGAMNYAYQDDNDLWNDFSDPEWRKHNFVYPTINGVIDTIQWEGWREGVNDIRYLTTLLQTIENAKTRGKNTVDVEDWLSDLKSSDLAKKNLDEVRATMINYILSLQIPDSPTDSHTIELSWLQKLERYIPSIFIQSSVAGSEPANTDIRIQSNNKDSINGTRSGTISSTIDENRPVLALNFDNNSRLGDLPTKAVDASGCQNNGTISGATWTAAGKFNSALKFDGKDDYVDCGNSSSLDITGNITVELWMKPEKRQEICSVNDSTGNYGVIAKAQSTGRLWSWQLRYGSQDNCSLGFQFNESQLNESKGNPESHKWVTVKQSLTPGKWYFVAGTFDGKNIKCYLNGVLKDAKQMSGIQPSIAKLLVGDDGWHNMFKGTIDEIRIYRKALTAQEIAVQYNQTS